MTSITPTQSSNVAGWLRELSDLERGGANGKRRRGPAAVRANSLRELIPTSILLHYDRLRERGRQAVAQVKRGICGSCHLAFPSGSLATLRRTTGTLNVCVHCGAFVYLADDEPTGSAAVKRAVKGSAAAVNPRKHARRPALVA